MADVGRYAVGVDLGGTNIVAGAARHDGSVLGLVKEPTGLDRSPGSVVRHVAGMVNAVVRELPPAGGPPVGVGVGVPGLVDAEGGLVRRSPNFADWKDVPLAEMLAREPGIGVPVVIDHDLRMITRGEWTWGAGRGARDLVCITVGTGIGMGIVAGGRVYSGAHGNAGELGHVTVDGAAPACGCGNVGCLEKVCAGPALAEAGRAAVRAAAGAGPEPREGMAGSRSTMLDLAGGRLDAIDARVVFRAAELGDPLATTLVDRACELLGTVIAAVVLILDPERIVLGGGIADAGDFLLDRVRAVVGRRAYSSVLNGVSIVPWGLKDRAGVMGAACTVLGRTQLEP